MQSLLPSSLTGPHWRRQRQPPLAVGSVSFEGNEASPPSITHDEIRIEQEIWLGKFSVHTKLFVHAPRHRPLLHYIEIKWGRAAEGVAGLGDVESLAQAEAVVGEALRVDPEL